MISDVTGLDYILLKDNLELKSSQNIITKTNANFLVEFDKENNIIIEINSNSYARILIKNIINILMGIENKTNTDDQSIKLIQIHLNFENNCKQSISKYRIKNYVDNDSYESILCIELSPPNCKKEYCSKKEVKNAIKWGALFENNSEIETKEILNDILTKEK